MNSESSHEPSELETIFKKIAEELDITLTKDNTSTEYSLWGSKDDDLIFSYSIGKNNKGSVWGSEGRLVGCRDDTKWCNLLYIRQKRPQRYG